MIKPGTLCMIRGVPKDLPGHTLNGNVVVAQGIKHPEAPTYWIEPMLFEGHMRFSGCRQDFLHPFEDFDPSELITQELETA